MNSPYGRFMVEQNECTLIIENGAQGEVRGEVSSKFLVKFFDLPMAMITVPQHWITFAPEHHS